jgi:hypothetical protein
MYVSDGVRLDEHCGSEQGDPVSTVFGTFARNMMLLRSRILEMD